MRRIAAMGRGAPARTDDEALAEILGEGVHTVVIRTGKAPRCKACEAMERLWDDWEPCILDRLLRGD